MALTKLTTALNKISTLATVIRGQAPTVKAAFDHDVNVLKDYINDTLTTEIEATFEAKNNITSNRKLSNTGDFTGTWNGREMIGTDPGIQSIVNDHTLQLSSIATYGKTIRLDSDSFGNAINTQTPNLSFINRITRKKNLTLTNASVNGAKTQDMLKKLWTEIAIPSTYDYHMLNIGFNDIRLNGDNINGASMEIANKTKAMVAYLRLEEIYDSSSARITYTGTWGDASETGTLFHYGGASKSATGTGAYCEFTFTGTGVSIGTFGFVSSAATASISIDGTEVALFDANGQAYSVATQMAIEISGLTYGTHTLRITKTNTSVYGLFIDWIGIPSATPPTIYVNGITKMKTSAYTDVTLSPYNKGSDNAVNTANNTIRLILANFDENVIFIDQSDFNPNTYDLICFDNIHPSNLGHEWIASNIFKQWH